MSWPLIRLLPKETHFKFVSLAPFAAVLSAIAVIASFVSLGVNGLNLGVDFRGGTALEIMTPGPAPLAALRADLGKMGVKDAQIQQFGDARSAMIRFERVEGVDPNQAVATIKSKLSADFSGIQFTSEDVVGATISGELFRGGLEALGAAIGLMLLYIWFRFQLQFGLGAVIALFHDIILTMGMLSFFHIEFSLPSIAALLTVIGYSMNEKVISFDRLRENLRKYRKMPLRDVINLSENERLSRTMITGATALLALSGLLLVPTIYPVIIAMVFGIVIGTYSSIYVALPVILLWGVNRNDEAVAEPAKGAPARP
ncbi:MAG: protein translocase subunit SecF [Caulobacteraceae bacterium]|nr:protein translocase subunit SecF [Caulobacteraceae bacterium]